MTIVSSDKPLTNAQGDLLQYILDYTLEHCYQPSVREMCDKFGVTLNAIYDRLKGLQRKGYIRTQHEARALWLEDKALRMAKHHPGGRLFLFSITSCCNTGDLFFYPSVRIGRSPLEVPR